MEGKNHRSFNDLYEFGPFKLDVHERVCLRGSSTVPVTGKAFDLLLILVKSAGHLKTREELIQALWPRAIVEEHSLTSYISTLRKALGDEGEVSRYIETVYGHGYRFIAPVTKPTRELRSEPPREATFEAETQRASSRRWVMPTLAAGATVIIVVLALVWFFVLRGTERSVIPTPVIAVLPFESLSADKGNAYFAAGIQDTILSKLAGVGELRVISRTSTERYPSHPDNLREVASQLGAASIMEGSVQKAGNRVMINVQLINAKTDEHIWAHVYTRSLADIFAVENDVATQVAAALKAKLLPSEAARLTSAPTHDPEAYLLFLKANYYANQVTSSNSAQDFGDAISRAVDLYHKAIDRDPHYALAWARLSYLKSYDYWRQFSPTADDLAEAARAARQALAIQPDLPQAHLAMGYVEYYGHRNFNAALTQFEQARQGLPNDANMIAAIALIQSRRGHWGEALSGFRHAQKLDPRNARWHYETGLALMMPRRYTQAIHQFDLALALAPSNYEAASFKAMALLLAGKPPRKIQSMLAKIPYSDNQKGLTVALRFQAAWLARLPDEALAMLTNAPDWLSSSTAVGKVPISLLRAQALTLKGNKSQARKAYVNAKNMLHNALREQPNESSLWSFLGLTEAGLGHKREAIQAGLKAMRLTPVSKDAVYGPSYLLSLAKIYSEIGEPKQAIKLLYRLLNMPAGPFISVPLLERDPIWDPLRQNPEFQHLLNKQKKSQNLPSSLHQSNPALQSKAEAI